MSNNDSVCDHSERLRDFAFDELSPVQHTIVEQHLASCGECAEELERLRLTAATLRALPDREIPRRIAFVSDKVFAPSPAARFFSGFWNSAARLGFATACVLAIGLVASSYIGSARPPASPQPAPAPPEISRADVSKQVDEAVTKAVARIRVEDAAVTRAALAEHDHAYEKRYRAQMVAMEESFSVLQKRLNNYTVLALSETPRSGAGE